MEKKMKFSWGCHGATGFSGKIPVPEIALKCENCGETMDLISGIGLINSGTHTFIAKCPKCHKAQKFNDDTLWKECLHKSLKIKNREDEEKQKKFDKLFAEKSKEFDLSPFLQELLNNKHHKMNLSDKKVDVFQKKLIKDIKNISLIKTDFDGSEVCFDYIHSIDKLLLWCVERKEKNNKFVITDIKLSKIAEPKSLETEFQKLLYLTDGVLKEEAPNKKGLYITLTTENETFSTTNELSAELAFKYFSKQIGICVKEIENTDNFSTDIKTKRLCLLTLYRIFKEKEKVQEILYLLPTEEKQKEMIDFIKSTNAGKNEIYEKLTELTE